MPKKVSSSRAKANSRVSGKVGRASQEKVLCLATRGVTINRGRPAKAWCIPGRASTCRHQVRAYASRLFVARTGRTC